MTENEIPLNDWLNSLDVLEPSSAGNLQVFGLRRPAAGDLSYLTLDEALESEVVEIAHGQVGKEVEVRRQVADDAIAQVIDSVVDVLTSSAMSMNWTDCSSTTVRSVVVSSSMLSMARASWSAVSSPKARSNRSVREARF